jgi:PAS domain S-box-containing protein
MELPYQRYFDATPCYLTVQDREFRLIAANQRFREDFGETDGRRCYQVYKQRSEPCERCPVDRTFRDGLCHDSEEQVRSLAGRDVSVVVYTTPIRDDQGHITAVMEMSTDITEIKILQKQLRESQERYRLLFDAVPCYVSVQDEALRLVDANRQFRDDFGDSLGRPCYEVYKHRREECIPCAVRETFADGLVHHTEEVVTSRSGRTMNVLVYSTPIRDVHGRITRVMEMSTDVTPIRELESKLASLGLLIGSISHGIKGLLTGLDGGIYMVNSGMARDDAARTRQGWEMVRRNVDRIRSLVLDILYYAKDRDPNWEVVSAASVAEDACAAVEPRMREHRVELVRDLDSSAGEIEVDAKAIRALLVNLMDNAVDACRVDRKKAAHSITVRLRGHEDRIDLEVADNGIGMEQETREKVFTLFFSSKGLEGTGLGLFIAGKIAQAHGGHIDVESRPDEGTSFRVTIPRRRHGGTGCGDRSGNGQAEPST